MLTLTVNSNTLVQDNKEKSLRDAVDVSMMLMYDSNSSNEGDSEIWNVVSKDQVKDTKLIIKAEVFQYRNLLLTK